MPRINSFFLIYPIAPAPFVEITVLSLLSVAFAPLSKYRLTIFAVVCIWALCSVLLVSLLIL